ncbi:MAG: endonuclease/exonuclease/phosphatase family protein [Candidatus Amulumruptor caecigallinarius]|nr:endonuclease/exonuclease/phosphatase family protein [Candidatus Amulumruptor caecigallinarius]
MNMRRFASLALALTLIAGLSVQAVAQSKKIATFGVAFYNLENLFDTINNNGKYDLEFSPAGSRKWDGKKYWSKINRLAYSISQMPTKTTPLGPAVIGVSEIENISVLEDLVKAKPIRDLNLKIVHHDSPDRRGVDVGLLYNPELFKVLQVTNHTLNIKELPNFKTRDQMCVVGLMGNKTTGYSRVAIIVNHWPSRRGGEAESSWLREAAAALSASIANDLVKKYPDIGVIVLGDLNDDPYNKSVSTILGAVKKIGDVPPGGFYNPFWEKLDKGIGSYIYRGGWNLFDQIIINSNLVDGKSGLKFHAAEVLNKQFLLQQDGQYKGYPHRTFSGGAWTDGYSDHLPTEVFFTREVTVK